MDPFGCIIEGNNRIKEARPTGVISTRRALTPQEGVIFMGANCSILSPYLDSAYPIFAGGAE